jgi:hypothetical protein
MRRGQKILRIESPNSVIETEKDGIRGCAQDRQIPPPSSIEHHHRDPKANELEPINDGTR